MFEPLILLSQYQDPGKSFGDGLETGFWIGITLAGIVGFLAITGAIYGAIDQARKNAGR